MTDLPLGWAPTTIGVLGKLYCGQSPPAQAVNREARGTPYVSGPDQWVDGQLILEKWTTAPRRMVPSDCIFITVKGAGVGTTFPGVECAIGRDIYAFRPWPDLDVRFVHLALDHDIRSLIHRAAGLIPGLTREDILNQPAFLPPVNEQRRIVEKVEALLARVNAARDRLAKVPAILKRFRQAVLAAACSGRLTENSRPDKPWPSTELQRVVKSLDQGWSPKCDIEASPSPDIWGVVKTTAIQALMFREHENKRLPPNLKPRPELEIRSGDLLITRAGPRARAGVCCLVHSVRPRLMICDKVYRFRADVRHIVPEFLVLALNAPAVLEAIEAMKTGISDSGVNLTMEKFLALTVPVPGVAEQREIVKRVDAVFRVTDVIENRVAAATARAKNLITGVLAKAFRGALVPTDAELARQEGRDYEPASVLLERIQRERERATHEASGDSRRRRRPKSKKA
jgi:restriction endonuclease S subunit